VRVRLGRVDLFIDLSQCGSLKDRDELSSKGASMKTAFRVILGIAALVFLASWLGHSSDTSSPTSPTNVRDGIVSGKPVEVVRVNADGLFGDYDSNEVATDIYLKGKIVEVTGRVQSINKDVFDKMYVSLATRNQFMPAQMHVISSQQAEIAALRKGQVAVFRCPQMKRAITRRAAPPYLLCLAALALVISSAPSASAPSTIVLSG
jgi:hypothetical protein